MADGQPQRIHEEDELEVARRRVQGTREEANEPGVVGKAKRVWQEFREETEARNRQMQRDVEEGKRRIAEKRRQQAPTDAAAEQQPVSTASASATQQIPALSAPSHTGEAFVRALGGFNAAFPFVGVMAAFSTVELMQKEKASFSLDLMTRGCKAGVGRWLPVGVGAALFYALEYQLRGPMLALKPEWFAPKAPLPVWAAPTDQSSWGSKVAAGALAGAGASALPYAMRWPGFSSPAGIAALVAAASVSALFMPDYEEVEASSTVAGFLR